MKNEFKFKCELRFYNTLRQSDWDEKTAKYSKYPWIRFWLLNVLDIVQHSSWSQWYFVWKFSYANSKLSLVNQSSLFAQHLNDFCSTMSTGQMQRRHTIVVNLIYDMKTNLALQ